MRVQPSVGVGGGGKGHYLSVLLAQPDSSDILLAT